MDFKSTNPKSRSMFIKYDYLNIKTKLHKLLQQTMQVVIIPYAR